MDGPELEEHIAVWRRAINASTDEKLLASLRRELSNSGWVQLKGYYLKELRDELERRGLGNSDEARMIAKKVIFLDEQNPPSPSSGGGENEEQ